MKTTELNALTDVELANKLASLKAELFNLRFTHATGSLANSSELQVCKRNIARVKTVMRQREIGIAKAPEAAATTKKTTKKTAKVDAEVKG